MRKPARSGTLGAIMIYAGILLISMLQCASFGQLSSCGANFPEKNEMSRDELKRNKNCITIAIQKGLLNWYIGTCLGSGTSVLIPLATGTLGLVMLYVPNGCWMGKSAESRRTDRMLPDGTHLLNGW